MEPQSEIVCRRLATADLDACVALSSSAGWNQLREDWALFLGFHPTGCFVAVAGKRLVGTVTAIDYAGRFAWIGMMLVHPDLRRRGIGTLLMNAAIAALPPDTSIRLDATPAGRTLYTQLGFVDEYDLGRLIAPRASWGALPAGAAAVAPIRATDLDEIAALDAPLFGSDRRRVLQAWHARTPGAAFQLRRAGRLVGYALGRPGANFATIGPVIAATEADARLLTQIVAQSFADRPLGVDSPARHGAFRAWLENAGFAFQRPLTRMVRGPNRWPGLPDQQWGVLGPEVG